MDRPRQMVLERVQIAHGDGREGRRSELQPQVMYLLIV